MSLLGPQTPTPGFSFANCKRNALLEAKGFPMPKATKTGTTIVGITFKDGVILGADTRATENTIVSDKNSQKIHYIAPNMYCCGAGTAADTSQTTDMVASQLELHRLFTNRASRVATANQMLKQYLFRYQGHVGAALILGGVDTEGPHVYSIYPHGSTDKLPYTTMGSGSLAAISVFEARWKPNLEEVDGIKLVRDAVAAGVFNDLGSGNNIDVCIIKQSGVDYRRTMEEAAKKGERQNSYLYPRGTTAVLKTTVIDVLDVAVHHIEQERMETDSA